MLKFIVCLILLACASNKPLSERGMDQIERLDWMRAHSNEYAYDIRDAFVNKNIIPGFDKRLVIGLFGKPDANYGDTLWWYTDVRGDGLLKIDFKNGIVKSLSY